MSTKVSIAHTVLTKLPSEPFQVKHGHLQALCLLTFFHTSSSALLLSMCSLSHWESYRGHLLFEALHINSEISLRGV